jgi:hypothetical protein
LKRFGIVLLLGLIFFFLFSAGALAQTIALENVYAQIDFPDAWLVLSPQLLSVYEPLLSQQGFDISGMAERYASEGVVAEAWDESFSQSLRVMVTQDERTRTIFDIARSTASERSAMAKHYETRSNFSATPYRYRQVEWQTHSQHGRFLFLRYNLVDENDAITERGVRYVTIQNGSYYTIDWTISDRRFTNRDLAFFKETLESFRFTALLEAPPLPAQLSAQIPAEVTDARVEFSGTATPQAGLVLTLSAGDAPSEVASVGAVHDDGTFSLYFDLPAEGTYTVTLTASKEGYADASLRQTVVYQSSLLPVAIDAWPTDPWTEDTFLLSGKTLPGSQLQLLSPKGLVTKKPNAEGLFQFELNTPDEGVYEYTLVITNGKYTQRRFPFTITRVYTQAQELSRIKKTAQNISYRNLQNKSAEYAGQVMRLSGYVSEITQGDGVLFIRLMLSRNTKGVWTTPVLIACTDEAPALAQGERAVIYGYVASPYYEQTADGETLTVPGFTFLCTE